MDVILTLEKKDELDFDRSGGRRSTNLGFFPFYYIYRKPVDKPIDSFKKNIPNNFFKSQHKRIWIIKRF